MFTDDTCEVVTAATFAEAASKIDCPPGLIRAFLWFYA